MREVDIREINIVILKCLHTIYLRLALAVAPEYDASTEQGDI